MTERIPNGKLSQPSVWKAASRIADELEELSGEEEVKLAILLALEAVKLPGTMVDPYQIMIAHPPKLGPAGEEPQPDQTLAEHLAEKDLESARARSQSDDQEAE